MYRKQKALEKEWAKLNRAEERYLAKNANREDSRLNRLLEEKVPANLQGTLDAAFSKAFALVFEKGVDVIEKTYDKEKLQQGFRVNEYAAGLKGDRKSLKNFSKSASQGKNLNLLLSGVSGVGLGILGIGIPDIVIFTGLVLKGLYEMSLNYGFAYDSEDEKRFILLLIRGAFSHGAELTKINDEVNRFIEKGGFAEEAGASGSLAEDIAAASSCMSKELLYMKFLQGIPVVGAVGGAYDYIYMRRIMKYAALKYQRRLYADMMP